MCLLTMVYSYSCISDGGRLCACSPWCIAIAVSVMVADYVPAHGVSLQYKYISYSCISDGGAHDYVPYVLTMVCPALINT